MNEYARSLPKDLMNFTFISQYLNSIDKYEDGARSECLLVTPPDFDIDPNL